MASNMVFSNAPNKRSIRYTPGGTTYVVAGYSGATYATLAALLAANDSTQLTTPDPGMTIGSTCLLRSIATGGVTDGSPFLVAFNLPVAPTDTQAELVSGSGQQISIPGVIYNIWFRMTVSTDILAVTMQF